jgi:hypothetical protein
MIQQNDCFLQKAEFDGILAAFDMHFSILTTS